VSTRLRFLRKRTRAIGRWLRGDGVFYLRQTRFPVEWHGTVKHGWAIDPQGISKDSVVYAFGVGDNISFDLSMIEKYGVCVHAFDPAPQAAQWLAKQTLPERFKFHEVAVSDHDGFVELFPPVPGRKCHTTLERIPGQTPMHRVPARRVTTIMQELGHDRIDILKMDVEGAEYEVVEDLIRSRPPIRQLLVEFHHRFPTLGAKKTKDAIRLLKNHGFQIFWISPNCQDFALINPEFGASRAARA
jgi:FkbM family methyltransferase